MDLKELVRDKVFEFDLNQLPHKDRLVINTVNAHSYCIAKHDQLFDKSLLTGDVLLPDGSGIVLAAKVLFKKRIRKIAGADIHKYLLEQANEKGQRVFYLGASEETLDLISDRIKKEYPNIQFGSFSPPYVQTFTSEENLEMIEKVNAFEPHVVFVGMTAPKQEKWVYLNQDKLKFNVIVPIGAVFDFYAGTVKRSHPIWIFLGLEWLGRLLKEPKRLWRRNLSVPKFLFDLLKAKIS